MDKAEIAYKLQVEAQDAAEKAIKQLEEFIAEDAQLDRENADNTIQILRERSRTLTSLSLKTAEDADGGGEGGDEASHHQHHKSRKNRKLSIDKSEKIPISVENSTLRFPNRAALEKIIEYINFESGNRFTLVIASSNPTSRPGTRGRSHSPNSIPKEIVARPMMPNERKGSSRKQQQGLNDSTRNFNEFDGNNNDSSIDVLTKVLTDDEAMIIELRNAAQSRNSLRSKHLKQLEENKEKLTDIKSKAAKKLLTNADQDPEFPEESMFI